MSTRTTTNASVTTEGIEGSNNKTGGGLMSHNHFGAPPLPTSNSHSQPTTSTTKAAANISSSSSSSSSATEEDTNYQSRHNRTPQSSLQRSQSQHSPGSHDTSTSASSSFDPGPSLVDIFYSAKKLLNLQPRVENRQLRKSNSKTQLSHMKNNVYNEQHYNFSISPDFRQQLTSHQSGQQHTSQPPHQQHRHHHHRHVHLLGTNEDTFDLLSPLSIDELQNTSALKPIFSSPSKRNVEKSNTPSLPQRNGSNGENSMDIDMEPPNSTESKSPTSDQSSCSRNNSSACGTSATSSVASDVEATATKPKSNLTSSLSKLKELKQEKKTGSTEEKEEEKEPTKKETEAQAIKTSCFNCKTEKTPLWRKDTDGNTLCNACGLFLKLLGTTRPLSLKTDVIKKRNSRKSSSSAMSSSAPRTLNIASAQHLNSRNGDGATIFKRHTPIAIAPNTNGFASSLPNQFSNSFGGGSNSLQNSRLKNVMILPKTSSSTSLSNKSIPIPQSRNNDVSSPTSAASSANSSYSYTINNNQPFKRKKSEVNIPATIEQAGVMSASSFNNRNNAAGFPSSASLNHQLQQLQQPASAMSMSNIPSSIKRTNSLVSSSSLSRRTSLVNISRKNTVSVSTPTNSLTSNNINMLNQRFPQSNYFDTPQEFQQRPQISRHNSNTTLMHTHSQGHSFGGNVHENGGVETPNSLNSPNSFLVGSFNQHETPNSIPATPMNVVGMLPSSIPNASTTSMLSAQMKQLQSKQLLQKQQQKLQLLQHYLQKQQLQQLQPLQFQQHHQKHNHHYQHHHQPYGQDVHSKQLKLLEQYRASKPPIVQHEGIDDELMMLGDGNHNNNSTDNDFIPSVPEVDPDMIDATMSMIDEEFFRNYTSLHNDDDGGDEEPDGFAVPGLASQDSSQLPSQLSSQLPSTQISPLKISIAAPKLTQFTSTNDAFAMQMHTTSTTTTTNGFGSKGNGAGMATTPDYKDLDWLKFEM